MSNYKFILTYDGTKYYGWEHQPKVEETIQGKMESVLSRMLDEDVEVIGCGRTDAGVSAKGYVCNAHLKTDEKPEVIRDYLNRYHLLNFLFFYLMKNMMNYLYQFYLVLLD